MRFPAQIRRGVGILCRMDQASGLSSSAAPRQLRAVASLPPLAPPRRAAVAMAFVMAVVMAVCAIVPAGCSSGGAAQGDRRTAASRTGAGGDSVALVDPADEAFGDMGATPRDRRAANAPRAGDAKSRQAQVDATATGRWAVMLATFSQADHAERAAAFRTELIREYPELAGAQVRRVGSGSAIVIGRFEGPDEKAAQAELKRVKAIDRNGRKPFAGALLLRTSVDDAAPVIKPHNLRNLRAKFPSVRPLFTLQVAAWSTFGDKDTKYGPMRDAAERYCAELRAKGFDAWFYHDEDSETSIVTVGYFDRRAYDTRTTLMSPEVEDLMKKFPVHLTNGEPVSLPVDRANPKSRMKAQTPRLVEVPVF
jgi:hypothetical protein